MSRTTSTHSSTQGGSLTEIADHLSGIKRVLISVAGLLGDNVRGAARSQLEWAASHMQQMPMRKDAKRADDQIPHWRHKTDRQRHGHGLVFDEDIHGHHREAAQQRPGQKQPDCGRLKGSNNHIQHPGIVVRIADRFW